MKNIKFDSLWKLLALPFLMVVAVSCTQDDDVSSVQSEEQAVALEAKSVTFSIGCSSTTRSSNVTGGIQTSEESTVSSLVAVLFTDISGADSSFKSGQTDTEADDDTFYGYQILVGDGGDYSSFVLESEEEMRVEMEDEGYYQICFVANPSDDLLSTIEGFASASANTIADFKALVETQDPATTPMPMHSTAFYNVYSGQDTDLGTVTLQRIMARIDIVNIVTNVVITKAEFYNRAIKTTLFRDESSTWLNDGLDYIYSDAKTYSFSTPLTGNSDDTDGTSETEATSGDVVNASKSEIYCYEQYASTGSSTYDSYEPIIRLYYYIVNLEDYIFYHDVSFATWDSDTHEWETTAIQRNYRYKILVNYDDGTDPNLPGYDGDGDGEPDYPSSGSGSGGESNSNNAAYIYTSVEVEDWAAGGVIQVSQSDIKDGYN